MGLTRVKGGGIQPTILDPIQNLYTGSTVVFTVTVASKDTTHRYNGQGSSNGYKIDGKFAPFLVLTPGVTYKFDQADSSNNGHPLRFYKDAAKVTAYTTNVTTNGTAGYSGAYTQIVTGDATPTILYYQCSAHGYMGNAVQTNGLASSVPDDGSITTAKLADDAVTDAKLANSINSAIAANTAKNTNATHTGDVTGSGSLTIASNAVTTAKIADNAVTAAKLASGVQTTINNNADNRVITGSGSANTLNGESQLQFDANGYLYIKAPDGGNRFFFGETGNSQSAQLSLYDSSDSQKVRISAGGGNSFFLSQNLGIGTSNPVQQSGTGLHVNNSSGQSRIKLTNSATGSTANDGFDIIQETDGNGIINILNHENSIIKFGTNDIERLRVQASGGISFNGDSAAANALDDYEEGTCSSIGITDASTSYVRKTGGTVYYTKVGRVVHLFGNFQCNEFANYFGGNQLQIAGFPFTVNTYGNSSDIMIACWGGGYNWWEEGYPSISMENNNTTHSLFVHRTPGSSGLGQYAAVTGSNVGAGSVQFNFDLIYFTDA